MQSYSQRSSSLANHSSLGKEETFVGTGLATSLQEGLGCLDQKNPKFLGQAGRANGRPSVGALAEGVVTQGRC